MIPCDFKIKSFSCWDQYLCMAFAQLTYRESLRATNPNFIISASGERFSGTPWHMPIRTGIGGFMPIFTRSLLQVRLYAEDSFGIEEVPGIAEKDIDVQVTEDSVSIKGEKKEEKEDKGKDCCCMERSYGFFHRTIRLPIGVDREKVDASFRNGILTVKVPKMEEAKRKPRKSRLKRNSPAYPGHAASWIIL
jgi:hypothetical protein